ncbi:MAG: outer rane immunogenic protein [Sphingomonadales bacterium]|jgi:outer membrane immunogenic protein|nr:outer rane immunogenic protein [Sphingomonadales bacterium]
MRKLIVVASLAAASLAAAPALAQDRAPFTGFHVEGIAGWDRPHVPNDRSSGVVYGAGVGYDHQAGGLVLGIEGEASDSSAKKCVGGVSIAGDSLCASAGRDLYVGGRVGALVAPTTLLYAKAGYTNARINSTYTTPTGIGNLTARDNLNGVRVGGGIEQSVGGSAYVKAEYRYSNYEKNVDRHQVVAGFGFRF